MRAGTSWRIGGILAIVVAAGVLLYLMPIRLGLDLRGGSHVVLEARDGPNVTVDQETMSRALAVIERRVNGLGVTEPTIQQQGDRRIIVELPGIKDQRQAIEVIGKTALLEFRDPFGNVVLTGADLVSAKIGRDQFNRTSVNIEFTREGGEKFAELTRKFVGQAIPIALDNDVISSPQVREPITGGKAEITGNFSLDEAKQLVVLLQAGSLPVPLEVMEVRSVGPILGQESIDRSLRAGVIGIILVLLFMLMFYKLPGGLADLALGGYVLMTLGVMVALRATLTLPGIAGLILSIGMAVDGNIIIFERIIDELRSGKGIRSAIDAGFNRALTTIFDSNVTTLISAAVLFFLGTGPIKGFAVILGIGILASMFTAIVVTRTLLTLLVDRDPERFGRYMYLGKVVAK